MMPVYVDDAYIPFGRMKMCHMVADTEEELHKMADKIGMRRAWFQDGSRPHYDVSKSKRALAVACGTSEITIRELIALFPRTEGGFFCQKCGAVYEPGIMACRICNPKAYEKFTGGDDVPPG